MRQDGDPVLDVRCKERPNHDPYRNLNKEQALCSETQDNNYVRKTKTLCSEDQDTVRKIKTLCSEDQDNKSLGSRGKRETRLEQSLRLLEGEGSEGRPGQTD